VEKGSGRETVAEGELDGRCRGGARRQPWLRGRRGREGLGEPGRCAAKAAQPGRLTAERRATAACDAAGSWARCERQGRGLCGDVVAWEETGRKEPMFKKFNLRCRVRSHRKNLIFGGQSQPP
jgi:hypothetical protein